LVLGRLNKRGNDPLLVNISCEQAGAGGRSRIEIIPNSWDHWIAGGILTHQTCSCPSLIAAVSSRREAGAAPTAAVAWAVMQAIPEGFSITQLAGRLRNSGGCPRGRWFECELWKLLLNEDRLSSYDGELSVDCSWDLRGAVSLTSVVP
jgi:hypothetical protein